MYNLQQKKTVKKANKHKKLYINMKCNTVESGELVMIIN